MGSKSFKAPVETRRSPLGNIIQKEVPLQPLEVKNESPIHSSLIDNLPQKNSNKAKKRLTSFSVEVSDWETFKEVAENKGYSRTELLNLFIKDSISKK